MAAQTGQLPTEPQWDNELYFQHMCTVVIGVRVKRLLLVVVSTIIPFPSILVAFVIFFCIFVLQKDLNRTEILKLPSVQAA